MLYTVARVFGRSGGECGGAYLHRLQASFINFCISPPFLFMAWIKGHALVQRLHGTSLSLYQTDLRAGALGHPGHLANRLTPPPPCMLQAFALACSQSPSSVCPTENTSAVTACANESLDAIDATRNGRRFIYGALVVHRDEWLQDALPFPPGFRSSRPFSLSGLYSVGYVASLAHGRGAGAHVN